MPAPILSESDVPLTERLPGPPLPYVPEDRGIAGASSDALDLAGAAWAYREFRRSADGDVDGWSQAFTGDPRHAELFRVLHRRDPDAALRLADAATRMPAAGDRFASFRLVAELGRGAFGRVFLAEQPELADRQVVLKVSVDVRAEAEALARLLHTNIVPVYSVHRSGPLQAVCMPYCGGTTLAHAVRRFRGDTVPESGKGLVTLIHSSAASQRLLPPAGGSSDSLPTTPQPGSTMVLDLLNGLSYVDAILWLGARLADALAHAHDRGILHRDLKPANVLLTDEGQPLLLDFNLASDTRLDGLAEVARLGGTLPYMPPEHIESFGGERRVVDGRGDLYALGVILYELLTGRPPFPVYNRAGAEFLGRMVADRQRPPRLRDRNRAVTPAVEAIVRKCLDPDPAMRYQTAHDLQDDLERQLHHHPLRYAPDPSWTERARKWARRHPRLSSAAFLGTCAVLLVFATASLAVYQRERRLGLEARETLAAFQADSRRFQLSLTGLSEDERRSLAAAVANGRRALAHYPAPDDPAWDSARAVRHLPPANRGQLREEVGVVLLMLAHAIAKGSNDAASLEEALRLNEQAARCFPAGEIPVAFFSQQSELLERLNRGREAGAVRRLAAPSPGASARDLYLAGWEHARNGRFTKAVPLLEEATRKDPRALWAWFLLGRCHDGLGRDADAIAAYDACLALESDAYQVWFNRGLARLRRGEFRDARADFDRAVELKPDLADAYFNRALAKKELRDYAGAEADLTKALDCGSTFTRIYFVRAQVRAKLDDKAGAESDRKEGLTREPADESSWTARGFARLASDPKGALADFEGALKLNPQYLPALHNKAAVLADRLNRPADAVAALDQAIRLRPEQPFLRAGRAVYLARLGRRGDAHKDAEEALQLSGEPAIRYQVAGVYALTSKEHPEDRAEAFRLLASALKKDYGFEFLDTDPELAPIRDLPEFKELVAAARALRDRR